MFNCTRIQAIGYYDEQAAEALQLQASLGDGSAPPLGYYDNEVDMPGLLYKIRHARTVRNSPFDSIRTGDMADSDVIVRLAAGQDPRTGKQLTRVPQSGAGDGGRKRRRKVVGYDLQISVPKSVSVLYALGSTDLRVAIQSAHRRAFLRVLRYIETEGLIITRTGARSARHEPASETVASLYTHILSRDLDPQLHTHAVLLNICVRPDGKIGAIDNHRLKQHGGAIAALHRCELAYILREELGLEVVRDGRNFKLPIVPDAVARLLSKRRIAIEDDAHAAGINTAADRKRAQMISNKTRADKIKGLSLADLTRDWARQARETGFDHVSAFAEVEARLALDEQRTPPPPSPPIDAERLIDRIFANQALLTWPQILRLVAEELQVSASADAALVEAESVRTALVAVDRTMEGDAIYTSETLIKAEHDVLRMAQAGRGRWHGVPPASVEIALTKDTLLSAEQRDAIAHALNDDAIVAIEGPPGAGKSHMTAALRVIAKAAGLSLRVTSVSWQATHVVRRDAGVAPARASALAPLLVALERGQHVLTAQDIVIVDEAGMSGLLEIAALARHCVTAGAKLILLGDTRQLQPVSAGAPMRALTRLIGHGALHTIRRQEMDWMRQASMDLAAGRASAAIDSYDMAGAIAMHSGRDKTLAEAAKHYLEPVLGYDANLNEVMRGQLLITSRNDDVAELNRLVRDGLKQAGRFSTDEIVVPAIPRHARDARPVDLPLSCGDRIMFGERVDLGSITLYNADIASVMWIEQGPDGPIMTLALDRLAIDGTPISFRRPWKDLVSANGNSAAPIAQHAYATTVHASQGATVDRTIVAMTTLMSAEPLFVAMTRHRKSLMLHADVQLGQSPDRSGSIAISQSGRLRGTDETLEEHGNDVGDGNQSMRQAAVIAIKRAAMTATAIDNPSRYIHDIKAWVSGEDAVGGFREQLNISKNLAQFRSRFQSRMAFPKPVALRERDGLALSPLELKELDKAPLTPAGIAHRIGLVGSPNGLHRPDDRSEHLRIANGAPRWNAAQLRRLVATKAFDEHPIVQIAVVMLRKSVQAARAVVRSAYRLSGLNPLARAFSRHASSMPDSPFVPAVQTPALAPTPLERALERRVDDKLNDEDDRHRHSLMLQLAVHQLRLNERPQPEMKGRVPAGGVASQSHRVPALVGLVRRPRLAG
ncbi:MobF family relaxase [Bosea massiliensis]|uniref:MobF family relaxase n=1 Tax=Bosea massiliensis TaxID=151419 RepID=A0ABW0P615_9HYPH